MTGSHSIRVVNDRQRRKTVDPYSHGVVGAGAGVHTLDALAAGDQIPVADVVVIHMLAAPATASQSPSASDFGRQTGRFHSSISIGRLILP
jgi:hypothetical protein